MKIRSIAVLLALSTVALGGCMQLESTAVIHKDGSGTYKVQVSMAQEVADALQELQQLGGDAAKDMQDMPDLASFDKAALEKKLKDEHCKLVSFQNETKDGKRVIAFEIAFDDVNGLDSALAAIGSNDERIRVYKQPDGNFLLVAESVPADESNEEETEETQESSPEMNMEQMSKTMAIMSKLMAHASELSVKTAITFPGDILENNATRVEGKTAYWEMDSSSMMQDHDMMPRVVFSGKGVKIDAPVKD